MFHTSTQRKHWTFSSPEEIENLRVSVNSEYKTRYNESITKKNVDDFLTTEEEKKLVEYYEVVLTDVSAKFQPPIPWSAVATAVTYMKRFYLKTSVMDYPPKEMYLICLYMACKVDEYNISAEKFVCILPGDRREKAIDFILSHELLLMQRLDFHLTVHNPYRPMEGFIIDMKTRMSINPDRWRAKADEFLHLALRSDAWFLFSPSQIGLAALSYGCEKAEVNRYVKEILGNNEKNAKLLQQVKQVISLVTKERLLVGKDQVKMLEKKLNTCRNPENIHPDAKFSKKIKSYKQNEETEMDTS
ncbi:cyclin-H-like [Actinia tenebrosa]|uniref:Cyclin-H n=1 Tax=Actinia tenebrosa TaxID=6105 RepID=A0A6P8I0P3_ACTTE|nr:cyclin-H-like [Actinia tenebrosa]